MLGIVNAAYVYAALTGRAVRKGTIYFPTHRSKGKAFFWILTGFVCALEVYVRRIGGTVIGSLFIVHLCFAAPLWVAAILLASRPIEGWRNDHHATIAYMSMMLLIGADITGARLIWLRF